MYLVSAFLDNYWNGEQNAVKKAVKICNDIFLCTYRDVDCDKKFFDILNGKKYLNYLGEEFADFWDAYRDFYDDCEDVNNLPVVVATKEVMRIIETIR